jgi:hypothetical protein
MIRKLFFHIVPLLILQANSFCQETIIGLQSNRLLKSNSGIILSSKSSSDTLELPFFDDFSTRGIYPSPDYWSDDNVIVNNTFTNRQPTTGVATFDALDRNGRLYETASSRGFRADELTSRPVNLAYQPSDNIWLSFLYQPGGLADQPEAGDSLILQFYAPSENKWYPAWRATSITHTDFRPVVIKIDQPGFLVKGFRFRFVNHASLASNPDNPSLMSNCDQWNIDYVKLDRDRNAGDTIFRDVAIRYPPRSLLKTYEVMPWKQFLEVYLQEMGSSVPVHFRNNDTTGRNITCQFKIWDVYKNSLARFFSSGAIPTVAPLANVDYNAALIYTFNTGNPDSALFRITCWLITGSPSDPRVNDTAVYYQRFGNYFAYDDGSAEAGYGINGLGSRNAMVSVRFKSFTTDTLRAIDICFNDSYENSNRRAFDLMVWDDNNGYPGNVIYKREEVIVEQGSTVNGFFRYTVKSPLPLEGAFHVGWKQRSDIFMNAGLDVNTPHGGRQFYWINGTWNHSSVNGSLMIRPVTGAPLVTSIDDLPVFRRNTLRFRPNPSRDYIIFDPVDSPSTLPDNLSIYDLWGRKILSLPFNGQINISPLHEGIYLIVTSLHGRPTGFNRLVKIK